MTFQHCRFNFGHRPFKYPPHDVNFSAFNDHGCLSEAERIVLPRSVRNYLYMVDISCNHLAEPSFLTDEENEKFGREEITQKSARADIFLKTRFSRYYRYVY